MVNFIGPGLSREPTHNRSQRGDRALTAGCAPRYAGRPQSAWQSPESGRVSRIGVQHGRCTMAPSRQRGGSSISPSRVTKGRPYRRPSVHAEVTADVNSNCYL